MIVEVTVEVKAKRAPIGARKCLIPLMRPARLERATFWFVARSGEFPSTNIYLHLLTFSTSCSHWLVRQYAPK
jgi:hypothetical protein